MKKIIILDGGDLASKTVEIIKRDKLFEILGYVNDAKKKGMKIAFTSSEAIHGCWTTA